MIEVEKIRKALEPYREDLGRWAVNKGCALGRLVGFAGRRDYEQESRRLAAYGIVPEGAAFDTDWKYNEGLFRRIAAANDSAPDGFPRYQAVIREVEAIRAEQEAEAREREPAMEGVS